MLEFGKPSDAILAMELGYNGVLLNSAVALAQEPIKMAKAFRYAVEAGRLGFEAGAMQNNEIWQVHQLQTVGTPFWHQYSN